MDYSYFSAPPQQQYYMGLPPTPSYDGIENKINPHDNNQHHHFDQFSLQHQPQQHYCHNLHSGSPPNHHHAAVAGPAALHPSASVDSAINLDLDSAQPRVPPFQQQSFPPAPTAPAAAPAAAPADAAFALPPHSPSRTRSGSSDNDDSESASGHTIVKRPSISSLATGTAATPTGALTATGNLTPAQSRRKAQNRAAQRAFRERKERHRQRAAEAAAAAGQDGKRDSARDAVTVVTGKVPQDDDHHKPPDTAGLGPGATILSRIPIVGAASTGHHLGAKETWDLIQAHPAVRQGAVDVADVCERLRGAARCNGQGPVFEEDFVWRAIEESARAGSADELI
ncbi:uncharacterized protein J3D65DRAFT_667967 [Phyllosticta citribraziliensis]|uniref:BZIP domain-containing protein n=1 Tax=Phyllosticta citribraziliensis TaxID=989973 RepID=A0ABR1LQ40_9PEZI